MGYSTRVCRPRSASIEPGEFLRFTLDPLRLAILGRAAEGTVDVDAISSSLDVDRRKVLGELGKLRSAGLLLEGDLLDREALRRLAGSLDRPPPVDDDVVAGAWDADEEKVLRSFFSGSRLTAIPASATKKLIILEHLAQDFEIGVRYPEREVNEMLGGYHDDYAALRRYMVEAGILSREAGVYWRSGGRVELE